MIFCFCAIHLFFLTACHHQTSNQKLQDVQYPNEIIQKEFVNWYSGENEKNLNQYHDYLAKYLKKPPNVFELSYNQSNGLDGCQKYQFLVPPQIYWKNIVNPLQLIEKLKSYGLFSNYRIVHSYSLPESKQCYASSNVSHHDENQAVDFQLLDENNQPYPNQGMMYEKICQFWQQEGREFHMGLGIYDQNIFHIDTLGYRTWGIGHSLKRSPCFK